MVTTRILLASILKPVNDSRMFHKLGLSLSRLPAEVHVCGFAAPQPPAPPNIFFHPIFSFQRLSVGRFLAPLRYLQLLFRVKPQVIIAGTFELLLPSLLYKLVHRCQVVYDIRENYYLNLRSQGIYPPLVRDLLAAGIRAIEYLAAPFLAGFFLAEKSYAQELSFPGRKSLLLENKFRPYAGETLPATAQYPVTLPQAAPIRLLYSGTISELYGVFEAIDLCMRLNQVQPRFSLTIMGYCPQPETLQRVHETIRDKPYIRLTGGSHLVPHQQIIAAIRDSHLGLLPYHPHPSLSRCLPTKLFEYLAAGLPVLVQHNAYWQPLIETHGAGFLMDFQNYQPADLLHQLLTSSFYPSPNRSPFSWESEEEKLLRWARKTIFKY